jgi:hypothetical protein
METPMENTEQTSAEQEAEETAKKAAAVEAYESEWYEVLKRRAAELEEAGESEQDDEA